MEASERPALPAELYRTVPLKPLSRTMIVVCDLLALGLNTKQIAAHLQLSPWTIEGYIKRASYRLPGNLPRQLRCIAWARGATEDVLTGQLHREYMVALMTPVTVRRNDRNRPIPGP